MRADGAALGHVCRLCGKPLLSCWDDGPSVSWHASAADALACAKRQELARGVKRVRVGGAEQDAFSRWRHVHSWGAGELRKIKRRASKRERRTAKSVIQREHGRDADRPA